MKQKCYKKEWIRPLKTPRQVRRYLRRQAWYGSFRDLVLTEWKKPLRQRLRTLWGFEGALTVEGAFDWDKTVQGYTHWSIVNECFVAWFISGQSLFKYRSK